MDDFYAPDAVLPSRVSSYLALIKSPSVVFTLLSASVLLAVITRFSSGRPSAKSPRANERTVWMLPYWLPVLGHIVPFLTNPLKLMAEARDQSIHGIFALNLGAYTHNIISDPGLVKSVMAQEESALQSRPIGWKVVSKFFGIPKSSKAKYDACWDEMDKSFHRGILKEPQLGNMLKSLKQGLEGLIPNMISFIDSEIDLQPWERSANASYISETETEIDLMSLLRDILGSVSTAALFGRALLEKHPDILHNLYEMDKGICYFLLGLPAWFPWPGVMKAHIARYKVWTALDDYQRALDAIVEGKDFDSTWGDLDDVSEMILKRHEVYRKYKMDVKERADLPILWALNINANMLVYWQILYILSTPGLAQRIREEIAPYAVVSEPISIGTISEAPKLSISHEQLAKNCPLLRATYFEALRLTDQPLSVRYVAHDISIQGDKKNSIDPASFLLNKGEYVTVPHDLHMRDPAYFHNPETFDPERFLERSEDGVLRAQMGTIHPYGGGPSLCPGRIFAERECLALVAGVLAFWDIEPANKKAGWAVPKQKKTAGVAGPVGNTRVVIKRRRFEWER